MRLVAAVHARMGSSRLPNKVMALILDKPMAWHVVNRFRMAKAVDEVVLSVPRGVKHHALVYMARAEGIACCKGSETDLLSRTCRTADAFRADAVVRGLADCPLTDPQVIGAAVQLFKQGEFDYVSTVFPRRTYPAGLNIEVYSHELLDQLSREISSARYREYFMVYLWERIKDFRTASIAMLEPDLSGLRWTVDYLRDLLFVSRVYEELGTAFLMSDVLSLLERAPEIGLINSHIETDPYHGLQV